MATYIPGVTDFIAEIQPVKPDFNFFANVMQTRQGRYDTAKKKVSELYGSLLYAPMTGDNNIQRRDEFFKVIDQDIKKISGMDLSLQQNQDAAMNIFNGFYDDKDMVNDMVWTKKLMNSVEEHDNLKACTDPAKCGGVQAWEQGYQALMYKREDFKRATDNERLSFEKPDYTPYYNWQKEAIDKAEKMHYDVAIDDIHGGYVVRKQNGSLVEGGLYGIFKSMYGDDPRVTNMYNTQAYVERKNVIKQLATTYGSEEEAEKVYVQNAINSGLKVLNQNLTVVNEDYRSANDKKSKLEKIDEKGALTEKQKKQYQETVEALQRLDASKKALESNINNIQNNLDKGNIKSLLSRSDLATAALLEDNDMKSLAKTMSLKGAKSEIVRANEYDLESFRTKTRLKADKELADHNALIDVKKMKFQHDLDIDKEAFKMGVKKGGDIPGVNVKGEEIEGLTYTNVDLKVNDNPQAIFEKERAKQNSSLTAAHQMNLNFLFDAFKAAKSEAQPGNYADQYLTKIYGKDYRKKNITDVESLKEALSASKNTPMTAFNSTLQDFSDKARPTADNAWGQDLLHRNADKVYEIKKAGDAAMALIKKNTDNNLKIVSQIKKEVTTGNRIYEYAPLLLTKGNFLITDDEAPKSFIDGYKKGQDAKHIFASDYEAKEAYKLLKETFFTRYNTSPDIQLEQGVGLTGSGVVGQNALLYEALDPKDKQGTAQDVIDLVKKAINQPGIGVVAFGDASDISEKDNSQARQVLEGLIRDAITARNAPFDKPVSDRPIFDAQISPVAGKDLNTSAVTIKLSPDYINKYVGSKDKKGPLYSMQDEIAEGLTVFFPKSAVDSPITSSLKTSNLQTVLMVNGKETLDTYEETAGTVDFIYNKQEKTVTRTWVPIEREYDEKTKDVVSRAGKPLVSKPVPINQVDELEASTIESLKKLQAENIKKEQDWAIYKKYKQK
jgi:hypothetical protein